MMQNYRRVNFLNCPIDALTMEETVNLIDKAIIQKKHIRHVVVNAAKLVNMRKDKDLAESVTSCDIINADGQAVVLAANLAGKKLPERVAGIDLMDKLIELAFKRKYRIFFLGSKEEIVKKVIEIYSARYSSEIIAGHRNGYFQTEESHAIAKQIAESNASILFVAMPSPTKEIFLKKYEKTMNVKFIMGVGGSFDVIAGKVKRAPIWMQKISLEWFYRFLQEPGRMWKRYLVTNSKFIYYVFKEIIFGSKK